MSSTGTTAITGTIVVGLDGSRAGNDALERAKLKALATGAQLHLVYVIEWAPYPFQTTEENTARLQRREAEVELAMDRFISPTIARLRKEGFAVSGEVRHGDVADMLKQVAREQQATELVVARATERGLKTKLFGTVTARLVMSTEIPITVVPPRAA